MGIIIENIEYYLPEGVITNDFLEKKLGIDPDFLANKIGITKRRIALEDESTSDMCIKAAMKLLSKSPDLRHDIDLLIVCTQNPDYRLPTTACIVQNKLGLSTNCFAFDMNMGCSGFIYSLITACNFLSSGPFKKALIITADQYSKVIDYSDKNTASIFGDAATATVLSKSDSVSGILDYNFGTDGGGFDKLILRNSGTRKDDDASRKLYMNGRDIFKFSMKIVAPTIVELLEKNGLKITDVKHFVLHQANKYMLTEIQKSLKITDSQMVIDLDEYGNTVSSTIPIALKNTMVKEKFNANDLIVMTGFGVGLSWGSILYQF